jgi:hypothetical protein
MRPDGSGWSSPPPEETCQQLNNLVQAYALFGDAAREPELAALFTADATWDGTSLGYGSAVGSAQIAALVCGHYRPEQPMVHLPGPPLLAARSDREVDGVTWCTATRWTDGAVRPVIYFHYEDRFVRGEDGQWRFAARRLLAAFPR